MTKKYTVDIPDAQTSGLDGPGLFGSYDSSQMQIKNINLSDISDYHNHTYAIDKESDEMQGLISSISINDKAIEPITVRQSEKYGNPYECIAGHRRRYATAEAGRKEIPAIIVDMSDAEADMWMVDSNVNTRTDVTLKELCYSLKVKYEALKKISKDGSRSDEILAAENGMGRSKVQDLIRLTKLTPGLFALIEDKKMTAQVGKIIAGLTKDNQRVVEAALTSEEKIPKLTPELAAEIVELAATPNFSEENVLNIIFDLLSKPKEAAFRITAKEIDAWFPAGYDGSDIEKKELIGRLVTEYFELEDFR